MTVGAITPAAPFDAPEFSLSATRVPHADAGAWFTTAVSQGLSEVNSQLASAEVELQKLATGGAQNLHGVMIRLEEARLSFQLLMQVRNRLLEAYQDISKMQV